MLKIEMDDVIGVLQSCKVQIGVIVGVLALLVIALIACRKMKKSQKFLIRSQSVIAAVLAILVTANTVCFGPMSTLISLATGNGTVSEKTAEEAKEVAQQVAEEGFVLLSGQGWLVTSTDGRDYHIQELKNEELTLVEQAERHAILLAENSSALIVENLDMSNSVNEEMDPALKEEILKKIGF